MLGFLSDPEVWINKTRANKHSANKCTSRLLQVVHRHKAIEANTLFNAHALAHACVRVHQRLAPLALSFVTVIHTYIHTYIIYTRRQQKLSPPISNIHTHTCTHTQNSATTLASLHMHTEALN